MVVLNTPLYERIEPNQRWTVPVIQQTGNSSSNDYWALVNSFRCSNDNNYVLDTKKLNQLNTSWNSEYNEYFHYIKRDPKLVKNIVEQLNRIIAQIHFDDFEIELTPNDSVKYTLLLPDKKILMITKSFEKYEDMGEKEIVFSIFENKKLILSDIKNLNELVPGINRYINMQSTVVNRKA